MAASKELHCPRCEGDKFASQEDRVVWLQCGHSMKLEELQLLALLDALVEDIEATRH